MYINSSSNLPFLRRKGHLRWFLLTCLFLSFARAQLTGLEEAVSIWPFDEGFGTSVASNAVDAAYDGAIVGSRSWGTGLYGYALSFDGEENGVEVAANPLAGAHSLTIQVYIKPTSIPDGEGESSKIFNIALERETEGVDRFMFDMLPHYSGESWVLSHFMSIAGEVTDPEEMGILELGTFHPFNQWHHVALVLDSISTDSVRIKHYVNHTLEYETDYAMGSLTQGAVFIGERYIAKGTGLRNYFAGLMDNVVLHTCALTPEEFMPAPGTAAFDATPRTGAAPLEVTFINGSPGDVTSWNWDFGDEQTSDEKEPSHTYTDPGTYTVTLTVDGPAGLDTLVQVDFIEVTAGPVAVYGEIDMAVDAYRLAQNYPNPFNLGTRIAYTLARSQYIRLSIYHPNGKLVKVVDEGWRPSGTHTLSWHGRDGSGRPVNSGIYLYRLELEAGSSLFRKAVLIK